MLHLLLDREVWPLAELPPTVDVDRLRDWDADGLIQVRYWHLYSTAQYPGDPSPPQRMIGPWFSVVKTPDMAGDWDQVSALPNIEIGLTSKGHLAARAAEPDRPAGKIVPKARKIGGA